MDAVEAAGGFVAEADKNSINLAERLEDAQKLDIPFVAGYVPDEEQGFVVISDGTPSPLAGEELVDINTASPEELDKLRVLAQPLPRTSLNIAKCSARSRASKIL